MTVAFIQNVNPAELVLIAIVAIVVFGRRLPEVIGQAAGQVQRARRMFQDLRNETGIDEEIRSARRTFEEAKFDVKQDDFAPTIEPPSSGRPVSRGSSPELDGDAGASDGDPSRDDHGRTGSGEQNDGGGDGPSEDSTPRD